MSKCKLCGEEKPLLKKSHIFPEFLHRELYDEKHRLIKINLTVETHRIEKISNPLKGEYDENLLCKECDGNRIGSFESYVGKILSKAELPEQQKLKCEKIVIETGFEFLKINNLDYRIVKLFLLSILWRSGISKRQTFKEVSLGLYEEKIRMKLFENEPSTDNDIPIVILSWNNDNVIPNDVIMQPMKHRYDGKTFYSLIFNGYIVQYFISENAIPEAFNDFRLKEDNSLSIIYLPKGKGIDYIFKIIGLTKQK